MEIRENVREGEIQEWILKVTQKKEKAKGILINYGKKETISCERQHCEKINLVNNAHLKKAT